MKLDFALEIIENEHDLMKINGGFVACMLPSKHINGRNFIFAPYLQI